MKRSTLLGSAFLLAAAALGCGASAPVDDAALTDAEAAAMVAEETQSAAFNANGAPTLTFDVPDMMCEHSCVPTVRDTLAAQPGVKDVKVELATKTATVAVDKDAFDPDAAVAALVDLQFTKTRLADPSNAKSQN